MPYLGLHAVQGQAGSNFSPGARIGALLGGHVNSTVSLNGEMTVDVADPRNVPSGVTVTEAFVDLAFSPLVHLRNGDTEFVFGPKIGVWGLGADLSENAETVSMSASGFLFGINAGVFIPMGDVAVGALLNLDIRSPPDEVCVSVAGKETCEKVMDGDALKVLGFTAAVLF